MVIPRLAASDLSDARLRQAADWLAEWDYHSTVDSPQAALFASFWHEFLIRVFDETGYYWEQSNLNTLEIMWENPDHPAWYNAALDTSDPNVLLTDALQAGLDWMEQTYGTDWVAWRWGDLHIARFQNAPLGQIPDGLNERLDALLPLIRTMFNRDTSVAGCPTCVNATSWGLASGNYDVTSLPSMRLILDLNDWENSRQIHTTGQSGNPSSPHYDDMIPLWSTGTYQPHRFSRDAVEAATLNRWELEPGG
jgi:penicillin amidase